MKKKLLCLFLVLTMMVSMLSMSVFSETTAPEKTDPPATTEEPKESGQEKPEEEKKGEQGEQKEEEKKDEQGEQKEEEKKPEATKDQAAVPDAKAEKDKVADNANAANAQTGQRPVWITAHRCNTNVWDHVNDPIPKGQSEVQKAINGGCNGVEVDIRYSKIQKSLVLCHTRSLSTIASDTLREFLELEELRDPRMCVVIYDIKQPQHMRRIMEETHSIVDGDSGLKGLTFIYSVADLKDAKYFSDIVGDLRSYEGICVDMDWKAGADNVELKFRDLKFDRCWYGNGIDSAVRHGTMNTLERNCKRAVEITKGASVGLSIISGVIPKTDPHIKKVETWTVAGSGDFIARLNGWEVDSVMVSGGIRDGKEAKVADLLAKCYKGTFGFLKGSDVRLATRSDSPFDNLRYQPESVPQEPQQEPQSEPEPVPQEPVS